MMSRRIYLLPVIAALVMSIISSRYLFVGSGLSLIPWGILALSCGLLGHSKSQAVRLGAAYGFSQSFIFLWIDKAGSITVSQFFILLGVITVLSMAAAGCAALAARISYVLKALSRKGK